MTMKWHNICKYAGFNRNRIDETLDIYDYFLKGATHLHQRL